MTYFEGFIVPVPQANRDKYRQTANDFASLILGLGVQRQVEAWDNDVPEGKVTDFRKAVQATADENVVYSWIEWASKSARDTGWQKLMADERMKPDHSDTPFDGKRMFYGGFASVLDV